MKPVLILTLILALLTVATIACLLLFGVVTTDQSMSFLVRALGALAIFGATAVLIGYLTNARKAETRETADIEPAESDSDARQA